MTLPSLLWTLGAPAPLRPGPNAPATLPPVSACTLRAPTPVTSDPNREEIPRTNPNAFELSPTTRCAMQTPLPPLSAAVCARPFAPAGLIRPTRVATTHSAHCAARHVAPGASLDDTPWMRPPTRFCSAAPVPLRTLGPPQSPIKPLLFDARACPAQRCRSRSTSCAWTTATRASRSL